jgi:hypothetical protein
VTAHTRTDVLAALHEIVTIGPFVAIHAIKERVGIAVDVHDPAKVRVVRQWQRWLSDTTVRTQRRSGETPTVDVVLWGTAPGGVPVTVSTSYDQRHELLAVDTITRLAGSPEWVLDALADLETRGTRDTPAF